MVVVVVPNGMYLFDFANLLRALCNKLCSLFLLLSMFVRVKTTPNSPRKSVQIVASERVGETVRQRIVRYVGIAMNDEELERMKELAEFIRITLETESAPSLFKPDDLARMAIEQRRKAELQPDSPLRVDLKKLREENRVIVGIHEIPEKLFSKYGNIYCKMASGFSCRVKPKASALLRRCSRTRALYFSS